MNKIEEVLHDSTRTIMIAGHVRPDGDCVGAVMGLFHYLNDNYPNLYVVPFLEEPINNLRFLTDPYPVRHDSGEGEEFDLAISLDAASLERLGAGNEAFRAAKDTVVIDHHGTNTRFGNTNEVVPGASSTCEVLTRMMDPALISKAAAAALFTGIVCDTGVFRFDSTTPETLWSAGLLIGKTIPFSWIIQHTNTDRDYEELKISSAIIEKSVFIQEEHFAYAVAPLELQEEYGVFGKDLGNVVQDLNTINGTDAVLFLYKIDDFWKGSLRSKGPVDVAKIAAQFGGGGHQRAAGFDTKEEPEVIIEKVRAMMKEQRRDEA